LPRRAIHAAWFLLHFSLIVTICVREALWSIGRGFTFLPAGARAIAERLEPIVETLLGRRAAPSNPIRRGLSTYWHLGGIEGGYGYFAPNVPDSSKLVFELHYPDGRVDYELPRASSAAAGLRVAGLVEEIGRTQYEPLRQSIVRMMVDSCWREHPDASMIRAVVGIVVLPTPAEFEQGKRESYEFRYAYDFTRAENPPTPER